MELAPWEKRIGEVAGRISVVASERDVLAKKVGGAAFASSHVYTIVHALHCVYLGVSCQSS